MIRVPEGWEIKPLKSIGTCKNGLTYSPDDIVENGGLLVLRSSNIQNSQIALEDNVFVREDIKLNYKVQENDILVCVRNGSKDLIGKNALITKEVENMAHGAFMTVFHSNINKYVFQIFQSDLFFKQVEKNLGATINSINNSDLLLFEFPFPKEKKEQEKIAKILSTLDNAIESTNRIIEKEKNIKTALMQELLTNGIDKNGQIRTPQTHTYKQSELGLIPDEWEVVDLEKISKLITDGSHFSPEAIADSEYKIINVKDLKFDNINFQTTASITKEDYEILCNNGCSPKQNDILLSKDGTIGKVQVYLEKKQCVLLSSIAIIRLKNDFNPDFYKHYLRSFYFDTQLFGLRSGSALSRIILRDIRKLKVLFVDLEEQKQIAKILTTQDKKIEREETNLSKLKELKKGLMNDLLSGVVRVKV